MVRVISMSDMGMEPDRNSDGHSYIEYADMGEHQKGLQYAKLNQRKRKSKDSTEGDVSSDEVR